MPDVVQPEPFSFDAAENVPNHPRWPLLLYRAAVDAGAGADRVMERLTENGWGGAWVDGVFPYPHYHPNAHEVLVVAAGRAVLRFGGSAGRDVEVTAGDVTVLPVGTGHQRLDAADGFQVVGAYPRRQERFETRRPDRDRVPSQEAMARVPRPPSDPLYGPDGPLLSLWPDA